jgi:TonB-dependent SusC/RagA subfamily outer membrane receptor
MRRPKSHHWLALCGIAVGLLFGGCSSTDQSRTSPPVNGDAVHTGYGSQQKDEATGSAASVSGEEVAAQDPGANDLHELLRGNVAGVNVYETAGGGVRIQIRGPRSLFGSSDPLYIVDGVAVEPTRNGRFPWVQPSNIESITVLKGSEASIYGVRGANGVIVIRTKNR